MSPLSCFVLHELVEVPKGVFGEDENQSQSHKCFLFLFSHTVSGNWEAISSSLPAKLEELHRRHRSCKNKHVLTRFPSLCMHTVCPLDWFDALIGFRSIQLHLPQTRTQCQMRLRCDVSDARKCFLKNALCSSIYV